MGARQYWNQPRRVRSRRWAEAGLPLLYPTFREGLRASLAEERRLGELERGAAAGAALDAGRTDVGVGEEAGGRLEVSELAMAAAAGALDAGRTNVGAGAEAGGRLEMAEEVAEPAVAALAGALDAGREGAEAEGRLEVAEVAVAALAGALDAERDDAEATGGTGPARGASVEELPPPVEEAVPAASKGAASRAKKTSRETAKVAEPEPAASRVADMLSLSTSPPEPPTPPPRERAVAGKGAAAKAVAQLEGEAMEGAAAEAAVVRQLEGAAMGEAEAATAALTAEEAAAEAAVVQRLRELKTSDSPAPLRQSAARPNTDLLGRLLRDFAPDWRESDGELVREVDVTLALALENWASYVYEPPAGCSLPAPAVRMIVDVTRDGACVCKMVLRDDEPQSLRVLEWLVLLEREIHEAKTHAQ